MESSTASNCKTEDEIEPLNVDIYAFPSISAKVIFGGRFLI